MVRDRALKTVLVLVGLLFSAAIYPAVSGILDPVHSDTGDTMMSGLYFALGIFLLIAAGNASAHRSLIAFAAWSSFAHALVMSALGFEIASERVGFVVASAVLVVIGVALIVLAPGEQSGQRAAAHVALPLQNRHIASLRVQLGFKRNLLSTVIISAPDDHVPTVTCHEQYRLRI